MGLAEHLAEHACAYNGCSQNAISLCASKDGEEPVYRHPADCTSLTLQGT